MQKYKSILNKEDARQILDKMEKWPDDFICPITLEPIKELGNCADGLLYEKSAIEKWLENNDTSPITRQKLNCKHIFPVHILKSQIKDLTEKNTNIVLEYATQFLENRLMDEAKEMMLKLKDFYYHMTDTLKYSISYIDLMVNLFDNGLKDIKGSIDIKNEISLIDGTKCLGKFEYVPEIDQIFMRHGKFTYGENDIEEGEFEFIPKLNGVCLTKGMITYPNGDIENGKFKFIPNLNSLYLIDGVITYANGEIKEGEFKYIHELNQMRLVTGKIIYPDKKIQQGKWEYNQKLKEQIFIEGTIIHPNGKIEKIESGIVHKVGMKEYLRDMVMNW